MARYFYSDTVADFLSKSAEEILGVINAVALAVDGTQQRAWLTQIAILKIELAAFSGHGHVFFEFSVPRVGKRIDVVVLLDGIVFVLEFKVGEMQFQAHAIEQVWDYALDLKNFHETSHGALIAPLLIATAAVSRPVRPVFSAREDRVLQPIPIGPSQIAYALNSVLALDRDKLIDERTWHEGRYQPTPTIIEAAMALYAGHTVQEISGSGADAKNLGETSRSVVDIVHRAQSGSKKVICFVTGVPGAGKTLVGLNISTTRFSESEGKAVYLSGNGPLVKVLQEALALDRYHSLRGSEEEITKGDARRAVTTFIQNVHHFRDAYVEDQTAPHNHVAIFDEAQRAWNHHETERFMRERGRPDFGVSEPEFLISCMDRHEWAVIVCLVGGGQEINRGEAGISGWLEALASRFSDWEICISPELVDSEYAAGEAVTKAKALRNVKENSALHLGTSMRSFRATGLAALVKSLLDLNIAEASEQLRQIGIRYPIVLTRSLSAGKDWVRKQARGTERFGLVVSSQAQRLKPLAIDVRVSTNPVHWFLKGKDDVRSSFFLEDAATEFDIQGLELDWSCVVWDADFRFTPAGWGHWSFKGNRWEKIKMAERQAYLKNAYRVLLTRARQGMVIVVPRGDSSDHTREPPMYDATFEYLASLGLSTI